MLCLFGIHAAGVNAQTESVIISGCEKGCGCTKL